MKRAQWTNRSKWSVGSRGRVVAAAAVAAVTVAVARSPYPSALVIRAAFDRGGRRTNAALAPLVPRDVVSSLDVPYLPHDRDARLDVHRPAGADPGARPSPVVVWVHGGGWVSGDKSQVANYLRILAGEGLVVVGVNYSIAPRHVYPRPVEQVVAALRHVVAHADELGIDATRVVLAGDSAGSHIAAQVAALATDPGYAQLLGVPAPPLPAGLRAVVLHCGAYDMSLVHPEGREGLFLRSVLRAYAGTRRFLDDARFAPASVARHVTAAFPPAFLTGGNADPLTPQGRAFARELQRLGVEVEALFAPDALEPPLGHEYQFDLSTDAAREALRRSVAFLRRHLDD